jgi:RNA polymerase sigma-70 factor (ECF subfamily)
MATDAALVTQAAAGHAPAFTTIVIRYRPWLVAHCRTVVGEADAEDVVQDALLAAHRALRRGDRVRELRPWLWMIAHRQALGCLRIRSRRLPTTDLHSLESWKEGDASDEALELMAAIGRLPGRQRTAIVMRELGGCSYAEISQALGCSQLAVRGLINRARSELRSWRQSQSDPAAAGHARV